MGLGHLHGRLVQVHELEVVVLKVKDISLFWEDGGIREEWRELVKNEVKVNSFIN